MQRSAAASPAAFFRDSSDGRSYCLIQECSRTGRALPHQNAPGAGMLCQAAHGRNARLRMLVIPGSGAAGCVIVDTAKSACLSRGSARPAFLFDQRACFPAPTWRCRGHGPQRGDAGRRGRRRPRKRPGAERRRADEERGLAEVETRGTLERAVGRSTGLHSSSRVGWELGMVIVGSRGSEHQIIARFPPPKFDTALECSQQFIRVNIRLLTLEPLEQFSRSSPWFGIKPLTQLRRHRQEQGQGIGANIADFLLQLTRRTSPSCHDVRRPSRNCSSVCKLTDAVSLVAGRSAISRTESSGRGGSHSAVAPDPASLVKRSHKLAQSRSHADRPGTAAAHPV